MKKLAASLLTLFCLSYSHTSLALPELPFCPAGGPPGWYNRIVNQHNNNQWQNYRVYPAPQYYRPTQYQAAPYSPAYTRPYSQRPPAGLSRYYQNNR